MRQRGRVFLLLGPSRRNALVPFAFAFGAAGAARLWGVFEFGFTGPGQPLVAGIELAGAALALAFARGEREGSA